MFFFSRAKEEGNAIDPRKMSWMIKHIPCSYKINANLSIGQGADIVSVYVFLVCPTTLAEFICLVRLNRLEPNEVEIG